MSAICWVNGLSRDEVNDLFAESMVYDAKTGRAYQQLMLRLRVYGSLPGDDKTLAQIAQCTLGWWTKRAWPALREIFHVSEEGRLYHPGVRGVREPVPATPETAEEEATRAARAARNQANALTGWEKRRAAMHIVPNGAAGGAAAHPAPHATSHEVASISHAESDATSTSFASGLDATGMPVASEVAFVASDVSRALSLSQQEDSLGKAPERKEDSGEEGERARASANATDATSHATSMPNDATSHATDDATSHPKRTPKATSLTPLAADWAPTEDGVMEARRYGYEAADLAPGFRDWYLSNGEKAADWNAKFRTWIRRQADRDGKRRQGHMTLSIQGGVTGPVESEARLALQARLRAVATMKGRNSAAPLAPPFAKLLESGEAGIDWLDRMLRWEAGGFRGETPAEFDESVSTWLATARRAAGD